MTDFGETTYPIARKEYRCILCFGPIIEGEKHSYWNGKFDGEFQSNRMHIECADTLADSGDYEFTDGEGEMPQRVKDLIVSRHGKCVIGPILTTEKSEP